MARTRPVVLLSVLVMVLAPSVTLRAAPLRSRVERVQPPGLPSAVWSLVGNRGTDPDYDFLGTTDLSDLVLRTNNVEQLRITGTGDINIRGSLDVGNKLDVHGVTHLWDLTESTSTGTGALIVDGGVGIGKRLNVGGQTTIVSAATGSDTAPGSHALYVYGSDQGIAVQLGHRYTADEGDGGDLGSANNFLTFFDLWGTPLGRIEGQTLQDYHEVPLNDIHIGLIAAIDVATGIAWGTLDAEGCTAESATCVYENASYINDLVNLGVTYESGGADYAEYLERSDEGETISAGDIVGVFAGKITKRTAGAERMLVVSGAPAVVGNMPAKNREPLFEKVALLGQVPVKVIGPVQAGDYIVPSGLENGMGVAVSPKDLTAHDLAKVVGRAWESSSSSRPRYLRVAVGLNAGEVAGVLEAQQQELAALRAELAQSRSQTAGTMVELRELRDEIGRLRQAFQEVAQPGAARARMAAAPAGN